MQQTSRIRGAASTELPPIVRIVLSQIAKFRSIGLLDYRTCEAQLDRIVREELRPRGFALSADELPGGTTRFVIQMAKTGEVCETIEYAP
ncbi:hypothetical protein ACXR0O_17265 [Verrucomicrobiota bacterium sgz303538]